MAKMTAAEQAAKWKQRTKNATADYRAGIERVTESPMEKAAGKQDKMLQNLTAAINSGKWANNLRSVPLSKWKESAINKGLPRISAGVDAAEPTMAKFVGQLNQHQDAIRDELKSMPDLTLQDNLQRMLHNATRMSEFKFEK